ncbi:MAG: CCA tRNA nucleotidyltransferase [Amylibacter sp.]|nr:CCA tRNA nucleotidyltransferase [Amylibacter sp.]
MRIKAAWLKSSGPVAVSKMLQQAGYEIYFVGGCVRNSLLNVPVNDIDMSTDALPDTVMTLAKEQGLRVIPTGVEHGTVTVVVEGDPVEVTTYRKDIETDGRRAVVAFSKSILDDAKRRDFTMNALYADLDGTIIDPLGGLDDLHARRIRFIENPTARIREDYLRILRFFRFHALYGDPDAGLDAEALAACAQNLDGIKTLSKERIGHEMRKLLAAENPAPSIAAMAQTGVLMRVIAGANPTSIAPLVHLENMVNVSPNWMRRLLALGGEDIKGSLRLSKQEAKLLTAMQTVVINALPPIIAGYKLGRDAGFDAMLVLCAHMETGIPENLEQELNLGAEAKFPISSNDVSDRFKGAALGNCLKKLKAAWIDANLNLTKNQLLAMLDDD